MAACEGLPGVHFPLSVQPEHAGDSSTGPPDDVACHDCGCAFATAGAFDLHRPNGTCLKPTDAGLVVAPRVKLTWSVPVKVAHRLRHVRQPDRVRFVRPGERRPMGPDPLASLPAELRRSYDGPASSGASGEGSTRPPVDAPASGHTFIAPT